MSILTPKTDLDKNETATPDEESHGPVDIENENHKAK